MKLTSKNLIPPGGWYFMQGRYRINGDTFSLLVNNVRAHRSSNGIEGGNVEAETMAQICTRWPQGCAAPAASPIQQRPGFWGSVTDFALAMARLGLGKDKLVSQMEANRRAAICAACHNNKERTGLGMFCFSCVANSIGTLVSKILGNLATPYDQRLKACDICGCLNKLQVWFPLSALQVDDSNRNAFPEFCWKKGQA